MMLKYEEDCFQLGNTEDAFSIQITDCVDFELDENDKVIGLTIWNVPDLFQVYKRFGIDVSITTPISYFLFAASFESIDYQDNKEYYQQAVDKFGKEHL